MPALQTRSRRFKWIVSLSSLFIFLSRVVSSHIHRVLLAKLRLRRFLFAYFQIFILSTSCCNVTGESLSVR